MMLMIAGSMEAQKTPVVVELWPNGAPNDNGLSGEEKNVGTDHVSNITKATITVYPSPAPNIKQLLCARVEAMVSKDSMPFKRQWTGELEKWLKTF